MKKFIFLLMLASFCFIKNIFAESYCIGKRDIHAQHYYGMTTCEDVAIKNIMVNGDLQTMRANFSGKTIVNGNVHSELSHFDSLVIQNTGNLQVELFHTTHVLGNIVFVGAPGKVLLSKTSWIHGKIINGVVVHA